MSRTRFMDALARRGLAGRPAMGTGTSIACRELMAVAGAGFPEAHLDAETMARLAVTGHTVLDFDVVMPLFSVCHEAAAMGCRVNWGSCDAMPESGKPIFKTRHDIRIPADLLQRPGCKTPIDAIALLRKRLGDSAAVCGKAFGSWTQAYHYFGVENFLMLTLDDPAETQRILEALLPVTIAFANAQIDAGADCILLGDHATRDLCSPGAYEEFLLPMHRRLAEAIKAPLILHICGDTSDRIGMIAQTGVRCFHWDTKTARPQSVRSLAGTSMALMGGVSNYTLLRGTPQDVHAMTQDAVAAGIDIVGPECAVPLATPLKNLQAITGDRG